MTDNNEESTTEFVEDAEQPTTQPNMDGNDLAVLVRAIDIATQRGAFRANELSQIGNAFDRVTNFLNFMQKAQEQNQEESENTDSQTTEISEEKNDK